MSAISSGYLFIWFFMYINVCISGLNAVEYLVTNMMVVVYCHKMIQNDKLIIQMNVVNEE